MVEKKINPHHCYVLANEGKNLLWLLYYDDVEINRRLNQGQHNKMGIFRVSPANFPFAVRSDTNFWREIAVVPQTLLEAKGINYFAEKLLSMIKKKDFPVFDSSCGKEIRVSWDYYGTLADLLAKHGLLGLKESFSTLTHICYICKATKEETCSCIKTPSEDRSLVEWRVALPQDGDGPQTIQKKMTILSEEFDAKRESCFIQSLEGFPLRSMLVDIGHTLLKGCALQQASLLFLKDKKRPELEIRRIFTNGQWKLMQRLVDLYPSDRRDNKVGKIPQGLTSFTMAQVMTWMKMAPTILSYWLSKKHINVRCECAPKHHSDVVRPISLRLRKKFKLPNEHHRSDHIVHLSSFYRIMLKAMNQDGLSVEDAKKWQIDLFDVMQLGAELNGFWTPKHHYTTCHTLTEVGVWISHLRDSNTLICEQDNKLIKTLSTNNKDSAYHLSCTIADIKSINLFKEQDIFVPRLLLPPLLSRSETLVPAEHSFLLESYRLYDYITVTDTISSEILTSTCLMFAGFDIKVNDFIQLRPQEGQENSRGPVGRVEKIFQHTVGTQDRAWVKIKFYREKSEGSLTHRPIYEIPKFRSD